MTPALSEEWARHASPLMRRWLASMVSRRRVRFERDRRVADFRRAAIVAAVDSAEYEAIEKDAHITEAAILLTVGVLSLDDKQLGLLARLSLTYPLVAGVQWFHPERAHVECREWLASGCRDATVGRIAEHQR